MAPAGRAGAEAFAHRYCLSTVEAPATAHDTLDDQPCILRKGAVADGKSETVKAEVKAVTGK